jgi:hypothetical protein
MKKQPYAPHLLVVDIKTKVVSTACGLPWCDDITKRRLARSVKNAKCDACKQSADYTKLSVYPFVLISVQ